MNKLLILLSLLLCFVGCKKTTEPEAPDYTFTATYPPVNDLCVGESFTTSPAITNPSNLKLKYEVIGGTKADGTDMSQMDLCYFVVPDSTKHKGTVVCMNNHPFKVGTHTAKIFVWYGKLNYETTLTFSVVEPMVDSIVYQPNAITWDYDADIRPTTSAMLYVKGKQVYDSYTFSLLTEKDKLIIDSESGVISPNPAYTPELGANLTISPSIKVTSPDGAQSVEFAGSKELIKINIVKSASARLGRFFIPTVEAPVDGIGTHFKVITPKKGNPQEIWKMSMLIENYKEPYEKLECVRQDLETPLVGELPEVRLPIWGLRMTPVKADNVIPASEEFETWLILEPKDFRLYKDNKHTLNATVWMQNEYVNYFNDGTSPTNVQLYMSNTHDYASTTINQSDWTEITTISGQIHNKAGGLKVDNLSQIPYLGNNLPKGDDTVLHLKNPNNVWENRQGPWLKASVDMKDFMGKENVIFAIRITCKAIAQEDVYPSGQAARPGNVHIANIYYTASER